MFQQEQCKEELSDKLGNRGYISQFLKQISRKGSDRNFETFRYLNSASQNFHPCKSGCLVFISSKSRKQTKQTSLPEHLAFREI